MKRARIEQPLEVDPATQYLFAVATSSPCMETYCFLEGVWAGSRRSQQGKMNAARARAVIKFDRSLNGEIPREIL